MGKGDENKQGNPMVHQIFGLEARTIAAGLVSGGKPASI
jgi:hypothetical protein